MERPPFTAMKYSGGGVTLVQLAVTDATGRQFPELMKTSSSTRSASRTADSIGRCRRTASVWPRAPTVPGARPGTRSGTCSPSSRLRPVDDARRSGAARHRAAEGAPGRVGRVLNGETARQMVAPVGVGDLAVSFRSADQRGWSFSHGGGNSGFRCELIARRLKVLRRHDMTNADSGGAVVERDRGSSHGCLTAGIRSTNLCRGRDQGFIKYRDICQIIN